MNVRSAVERMFGANGTEKPAPDALTLIHSDHEEVDALFKIALGEGTPAAQKRTAVTRLCDALTVHAKMEEAIFYPALRKAGKAEEKDSVLEAAEEHAIVKELIAKIRRVEGRDETLKAKLTVLKESVQHHVHEEESTIFSEARRVLGNRLEALGAEMQRFKDRAMGTSAAKKTSTRAGAARKTSTRTTTKPTARKKNARR